MSHDEARLTSLDYSSQNSMPAEWKVSSWQLVKIKTPELRKSLLHGSCFHSFAKQVFLLRSDEFPSVLLLSSHLCIPGGQTLSHRLINYASFFLNGSSLHFPFEFPPIKMVPTVIQASSYPWSLLGLCVLESAQRLQKLHGFHELCMLNTQNYYMKESSVWQEIKEYMVQSSAQCKSSNEEC